MAGCDVGVADWRRPGERVGHVFSLPELRDARRNPWRTVRCRDDGRTQGLKLLKGDGFVDAEEAGPVKVVPDDEIRDAGCGETHDPAGVQDHEIREELLDQPNKNDELLIHGHVTDVTA